MISLVQTINVRVHGGKVPGERIALKPVSTTAALKVELRQLLRNADIGLELRSLKRSGVAHGIPNGVEHNLGISDRLAIQNLRYQHIQFLCYTLQNVAHGTCYIQANNNRIAARMVCAVPAFSDRDIFRIKFCFHHFAGVNTSGALSSDRALGITVPIVGSPTSTTHTSFLLLVNV